MVNLRKAEERGIGEHGWLSSRHTFSFASYYDPQHMGFRSLRVINEDRVTGGNGFGTHPHKDMEIISYVLDGALEHADSMGTGSVIEPGDVQRMSAGTGVWHSEYNHSKESPVHFLQIWIEPERKGLAPGYEQKRFPKEERKGVLKLLGSQDGRDGSIKINQDVSLYGSILGEGEEVTYEPQEGRYTWVHVAKGEVEIEGKVLKAGDAISSDQAKAMLIKGLKGEQEAELLVFDLA